MFSCFRDCLERFIQVAFGDLFPSPGLYSKENETPWCCQITVSGRTGLIALLGEHLGSMLPDTDIHLKTESDVVRPRFMDRVWTKRKDTATVLFFLVLWMTLTESFISWVFLFIYAVHSMSLSFPSHRSVELCVLNKIVCLSEHFPSVFDEIVPS